MSRHAIRQAIILHQHPIGENHASLTLLSADGGLISAMAHGVRGKSSRLRPLCQTYSLVRAWLFQEPNRPNPKLTDLEVVSDYMGIRENLHALYHAAATAELLRATPLTDSENWAFSLYLLYLEQLDALVAAGAAETARRALPGKIAVATIQFLWRYLGLSGFQPDPDRCAASGALLAPDEAAAYSYGNGGFVHLDRAPTGARSLPAGALQYLRYSRRNDFAAAAAAAVSAASRNALMAWLLELTQENLGFRLRSLAGQDFLFYFD